jgi:hypothetical protein
MFRNNSVQSSHVHVSCLSVLITKRLFSQVGIALSAKRKRAEPDTLEDIMFSRICHEYVMMCLVYTTRIYHLHIVKFNCGFVQVCQQC